MSNTPNPEIFDLLKQQILLRYLNEEQLSYISKIAKIIQYHPNEIILKEGERSHQLYMILDGEVEVLKWDKDHKHQFTLCSFSQGDAFGEMSFVDKAPRSSSVKALKETRVLVLDQKDFNVSDPNSRNIYNQIISNILEINTRRLRSTSQGYAQALRLKLREMKRRNEFVKVFIIILICFGINNLFNLLFYTYNVDPETLAFNWSYIFLFLIPIILYMIKEKIAPQTFGVTFKNTRKCVKEGVIISIILTIIFLLVLFVYAKITGETIHIAKENIWDTYTNPTLIPYFFHVYAQEFIARGALQTSLERFLTDSRKYVSILIASFIFFVFHLHLGLLFAFITFISSVFFGFIYIRERNLIGVTIVHFVLGTFGKVFRLF